MVVRLPRSNAIIVLFSLMLVSQSWAAFDPGRTVLFIDPHVRIIGLTAKSGEPVYHYQLTKSTPYGERAGTRTD